jgi:RNA polymerase sigma-54 factor
MANMLNLHHATQQRLMPKTIQSLQLLSLPLTALNEYLINAVTENPFLELDYPVENPTNFTEFYNDISTNYRRTDSDKEIHLVECLGKSEPETDTLAGFLQLQVSLCNFSLPEQQIASELIGNIDNNGYFVGNLETIACYYNKTTSVIQQILTKIQSFYPLGIGARNLTECLLLQLNKSRPDYPLIRDIISYDLEDLAYRRFSKLAKKYKISKDHIQQIMDYVGTLNPRPGNVFNNQEKCGYIIPDIIIERNGKEYSVAIKGRATNFLHINEEYLRLRDDAQLDANCKTYLYRKYSEAKTLIQCIEMRYNMLREFALFIIKEQNEFLQRGKAFLKPLTMQKAAEEIGVSVSTISRTVHGKYMQTPWGLFPLKYFFSSSFPGSEEQKISGRVIKDLIKKLIIDENPYSPLTDANIAEILQKQGITISRRTVSKYRQALGFEGQKERQRFC